MPTSDDIKVTQVDQGPLGESGLPGENEESTETPTEKPAEKPAEKQGDDKPSEAPAEKPKK